MAYTTINKGSDYFNTLLYTGTGSAQSLTGVGFQPDLCFFAKRNGTSNHAIFDVIRGAEQTIYSDLTIAEVTKSLALTSFDSDGFSLGGASGETNDSGGTYVAWNWLADNTSGSSNTDGSITSTVSANTTSGFSIVSYTGTGANATIGHGLGSAPKVVIIKNRSTIENWVVGHKSLGFTNFLSLDATNAAQATSNRFNDTDPTSSVFSVGSADGTNKLSDSLIAYCFAEKKGFSKFGSYTGNGSTDGTFVYTGFKPAFVIIKRTDSTSNWNMADNKRSAYNLVQAELYANSSAAEDTAAPIADFLSNGFKIRSTSTAKNASGGTYIYMCFAEFPTVSSTGTPVTAR